MFEDIQNERSLILLLSIADPDIVKQSGFVEHEILVIGNLASQKAQNETEIIKGVLCSTTSLLVFSIS